jgi:hypothetical protein
MLMVDVADPGQPVLAGTINGNFGNWVSTDSLGLVVGASNNGNAGIQVTSLGLIRARTLPRWWWEISTAMATPSSRLA